MTVLQIANAPNRINYGIHDIKDIEIIPQVDERGKDASLISIGGCEPVATTNRFWTSMCSRFSTLGLTTRLFRMFSHEEVFTRLRDRIQHDSPLLRFAVETTNGKSSALAVSSPDKAIMGIDDLRGVFDGVEVDDNISYTRGVVRSVHQVHRTDDFMVGPDMFQYRITVDTPIDGFGAPLVYLSLLRLICANGMVGYSNVFRSQVNLGKNGKDGSPDYVLSNAIRSFNNEDGFSALRDRVTVASTSRASMNECYGLHQLLTSMEFKADFQQGNSPTIDQMAGRFDSKFRAMHNIGDDDDVRSTSNNRVMNAYTELTGDMLSRYGLTHYEVLSTKKQSQLPANCTVGDLMTFGTELATHHTEPKDAKKIHAHFGGMLAAEYDLEGMDNVESIYEDLYLKPANN